MFSYLECTCFSLQSLLSFNAYHLFKSTIVFVLRSGQKEHLSYPCTCMPTSIVYSLDIRGVTSIYCGGFTFHSDFWSLVSWSLCVIRDIRFYN